MIEAFLLRLYLAGFSALLTARSQELSSNPGFIHSPIACYQVISKSDEFFLSASRPSKVSRICLLA